jgi:hypothetical protein
MRRKARLIRGRRKYGGGLVMKARIRRGGPNSFLIYLLFGVVLLYLVQTVLLKSQPSLLNIALPLALLGWLGIAFAVALVQGVVVPILSGVACPKCSKPALERVAVRSFGPRYFRCGACGSRVKRVSFGRWEEVIDPAEAAIFDPVKAERVLEVDTWAEEDAGMGAKSIDSLVRNKRRRNDPE